jgi:hypothetical protein
LAENAPIRVNTAPEGVEPGQYFFQAEGKGVRAFKTESELRTAANKAGVPIFQYDPTSTFSLKQAGENVDVAQTMANLRKLLREGSGECHGLECSGEGTRTEDTAMDQAALGAAAVNQEDPGKEGKSGGVAGGACPTCEGSRTAQAVDVARAVIAVVSAAVRAYKAVRTAAAARSALQRAEGTADALRGAQLKEHLRQLEKYGSGGFKELKSGRIRYYGELSPASKPGPMVGRRFVREWDPASGATRSWHETLDRAGRIRIVRPETGGRFPFRGRLEPKPSRKILRVPALELFSQPPLGTFDSLLLGVEFEDERGVGAVALRYRTKLRWVCVKRMVDRHNAVDSPKREQRAF